MKTKVNSRIWGLRTVMANGGDIVSGKMYYISMVRSLLEINVEIWNGRLTAKNVLDLENIQIRCFKIILKNKYRSYHTALELFELERLSTRRESLCLSFIRKAVRFHPELYPLQPLHPTRLGEKDQSLFQSTRNNTMCSVVRYICADFIIIIYNLYLSFASSLISKSFFCFPLLFSSSFLRFSFCFASFSTTFPLFSSSLSCTAYYI